MMMMMSSLQPPTTPSSSSPPSTQLPKSPTEYSIDPEKQPFNSEKQTLNHQFPQQQTHDSPFSHNFNHSPSQFFNQPPPHHIPAHTNQYTNTLPSKLPKYVFPKFDGTDVRPWLRKCFRYFALHHHSDQEKIHVAAMNLEGRAEIWFHGMMSTNPPQTWQMFTEALAARFDGLNPVNVISEYNKLVQHSSVSEYIDQFEELRGLMFSMGHYCDELYFISSFISGLKEELQHGVKMLKPSSVASAYELALDHEKQILSLALKFKSTRSFSSSSFKPTFNSNFTSTKPQFSPYIQPPAPPNNNSSANTTGTLPRKILTTA